MDESQIKDLYSSSTLAHDTTAKLVYSYLIHNCYSSTAESFGSALRIQPNQDVEMSDSSVGMGGLVGASPEHLYLETLRKPLDSLNKRQHIMSLVLDGSVSKAKQAFLSEFPHILDDSKSVLDVLFLLSCQEFIELVSQNSDYALEYAKVELSKFSQLEYKNEMEELVSLLAYTNPHNSPVAHYLTVERRELVARKLNRLILSYDGWPIISPLENDIRQLVCVRDILHSENDKKVSLVSNILRYHIQDGILVILFRDKTFLKLVFFETTRSHGRLYACGYDGLFKIKIIHHLVLGIFVLIHHSVLSAINADEYHVFIDSFDRLTDIIGIKIVNASKQMLSGLSARQYTEVLTLDETIHMSNIFRTYLKENMRIFADQDIKEATLNRNGNYYAWVDNRNVWLNRSSGHTYDTEAEAQNANLNSLWSTLEKTVFDLSDPSSSALEKRQWLRSLSSTIKKVEIPQSQPLRESHDHSQYYFDAVQDLHDLPVFHKSPNADDNLWTDDLPPSPSSNGASNQDEFFDALQDPIHLPSKPSYKPSDSKRFTPSNAKPRKKLKWSKYFAHKLRQSRTLGQKIGSISFKEIRESLCVYWDLLKIPLVRRYVRYYLRLKFMRYFALRRSVRKEAADELRAINEFRQHGHDLLYKISRYSDHYFNFFG